MRRNLLHIALLLSLGLYYNGAAVLWFSYSTFAKDFFASRCENPTKPCCQGKCQVKKAAGQSGNSEESGVRIQTPPTQPTLTCEFVLSTSKSKPQLAMADEPFDLLSGITNSPFHPPKA
jgi:hypothetical protein